MSAMTARHNGGTATANNVLRTPIVSLDCLLSATSSGRRSTNSSSSSSRSSSKSRWSITHSAREAHSQSAPLNQIPIRQSFVDRSSIGGAPIAESPRVNVNIVLTAGARDGDGDGNCDGDDGLVNCPVNNLAQDKNKENVKMTVKNTNDLPKVATAAAAPKANYRPLNSIGGVVGGELRRRAPLVRAMSAPLRPNAGADTVRNIGNNLITVTSKRRTRRKKSERDTVDDGGTSSSIAIVRNDESTAHAMCPDNVDKNKSKSSGNGSANGNGRSIFSTAYEVETLVSLLSSGGSDDSEREDTSVRSSVTATTATAKATATVTGATGTATASAICKNDRKTTRAVLLMKNGKSVSFQESEHNTYSTIATKEFSHLYRRASIAPIAARIRLNRPPTAPAGSIFRVNCRDERHDTLFSSVSMSGSSAAAAAVTADTDRNTAATGDNQVGDEPAATVAAGTSRSSREHECWTLFQKMSRQGIAVSYETLLRGMLKPTEFRLIKKQRDIEANVRAQQAAIATAEVVADGCEATPNASPVPL